METSYLQNMKTKSIARLMFDGDKISTKYKIRPFSYDGTFNSDNPEDLGEEQIVIPGDRFNFIPYLKRIDIFLNKKETVNPKILELLEKANIPYKVYQGTPISNIPYNQPKTGDPKDIDIEKIPEKKEYTREELFFPGMEAKEIELYNSEDGMNKGDYPRLYTFYSSPEYPDYYINEEKNEDEDEDEKKKREEIKKEALENFLNAKEEFKTVKYETIKVIS